MRYLKKDPKSPLITSEIGYDKPSERPKIRRQLLTEQAGFCAYSERYIKNTDVTDIEHFDPRLKSTLADNYYNWYVVLPWFNLHKPKKIDPFLPILQPNSPDLYQRICYQDGLFQAIDKTDEEARHLIKFLKWDSNEWYEDCQKHLQRIKTLRELCGDESLFIHKLKADRGNFSFATAIEAELGIDVGALLDT
jgi:hypothetical protein